MRQVWESGRKDHEFLQPTYCSGFHCDVRCHLEAREPPAMLHIPSREQWNWAWDLTCFQVRGRRQVQTSSRTKTGEKTRWCGSMQKSPVHKPIWEKQRGLPKEVTSKVKSEELAGERTHRHVRETTLHNYYGLNCVLPKFVCWSTSMSEGDHIWR